MHILAIYRRISPIRVVNDLRSDFIASFRWNELHPLTLVPCDRNEEKGRREYKKGEETKRKERERERERGKGKRERFKR